MLFCVLASLIVEQHKGQKYLQAKRFLKNSSAEETKKIQKQKVNKASTTQYFEFSKKFCRIPVHKFRLRI